MAEERSDDPWKIMIEEIILFFEQRPVAGAMEHQTKRTFERHVVQELVKYCSGPPCPPAYRQRIEQDSQRYKSKCDLQGELNERKIALVPDEFVGDPGKCSLPFRLYKNRIGNGG